jgi:hypothetical protein
MKYTLLLSLLISLSGCFELIEDIQVKADGSGIYKLTMNLSASKVKVMSVLSLDTIKGKAVPKQEDIEREIQDMITFFNAQNGISNATGKIDLDDLIIRIQIPFQSLKELERSILSFVDERNDESPEIRSIFQFQNNEFKRYSLNYLIPSDWKTDLDKEDLEKLKESNIVLITRFDKPITHVSLPQINISKSGLATMYKTSATHLLDEIHPTAYTIRID